MALATVRRPRAASPERWQAALHRAIAGNVQVRQLAGSGAWIATSATDLSVAYELSVTNGVVGDCSCPAAQLGSDPVCVHRAAFWHQAGILDLDPEPEPPAPVAAMSYQHGGRVVNFEQYADGIYWAKGTGTEGRTVQVGPRGTLTELRERFTSRGWEPVAA